MADLSLLFQLRSQYDGAGTKAAQADVQKLHQVVGTSFPQMQRITTNALSGITSSLTSVSQRIPIVGTAVNGLNTALSTVTTTSAGTSAGLVAAAGAAGIVVVAVGALTVGLVKAGEAFFTLTKQAAEFTGKFADLSQQVGVSAETLSTLNIFAETTGGNIETVSASLAIFQKHLEAAHDPTSKEGKLLKELGVTSLDTETALRQTFKGLANLGEGAKQTASALELFGRSGRFVNAIVKESGGNFDEAQKQVREWGLEVSTEAARAADQFNDSLKILNNQVDALGRHLVSDSIPVFIAFFQDISEALSGNKESWRSWSEEVSQFVAFVLSSVKGLAVFLASGGTLSLDQIIRRNFEQLLADAEKVRNKIESDAAVDTAKRLARGALAGSPGDQPDAGKATSDAAALTARRIALSQKALEEATRAHVSTLEKERDRDLKSIEEWEQESITELLDHQIKQDKIYNDEVANVNRFVKGREAALLALSEIELKRLKSVRETADQIDKVQQEAQRKREQSELNLNKQLAAIRDEFRQGELQAIEKSLRLGEIAESGSFQRQIEVLKQAFSDRKILRDLELSQQTTAAEKRTELINEQIKDEVRLTNEIQRLTDLRIQALLKEGAAQTPGPGGKVSTDIPNISQLLEQQGEFAPEAEKRFRGLQSAIDDLGNSLGKLFGASEDFGRQFGDVIGGAIDDLAFGIGNLVEQYVLLGETGPHALRKLLAATLAHLAAEAAVKAIFQLAEGFAALFYNPAEAAAHFTSAALFGAIAGATAVAGRKVAGDLFKSNTSSGGDRSSSGGRGQLDPLTLNRNQPQPLRVTVMVVPDGSKFGQAVTAHILEDGTNAGPIREFYANDGKF